MSYKVPKPGLVSVFFYLSMRYTVFIRAPFYVSLVFVAMCSVFWLFWLSYQYLPSDWLERLLWASLIMSGDRHQKAQAEECAWFSWFIVLLHCFMYLCCLLPLRDIFSYFYGAVCAERAVKPQANKQTGGTGVRGLTRGFATLPQAAVRILWDVFVHNCQYVMMFNACITVVRNRLTRFVSQESVMTLNRKVE